MGRQGRYRETWGDRGYIERVGRHRETGNIGRHKETGETHRVTEDTQEDMGDMEYI